MTRPDETPDMGGAESIESMMAEVETRLGYMGPQLATRVDPRNISVTSKIPFKVVSHREALAWRMVQLSRSALTCFKNDELASAIVLTRAAIETAASLWYLKNKVQAVLDAGTLGDIDVYLMRLIGGSKINPDVPQAINVLTFVDAVDREVSGFRHQYDVLSEFAHPNRDGTAGLFSNPDFKNVWTDFGVDARDVKAPKMIGVVNLSVGLDMFEVIYNDFADLMPPLISIAEKELKPAQGS